MRDRDTGRSRGFGFVTYSNGSEADAAIAGLNEQDLDGRRIKVNLANARGGGGGGGGGGLPKTFKRFSVTEVIFELFSQVTVEAEVHMAVLFDF